MTNHDSRRARIPLPPRVSLTELATGYVVTLVACSVIARIVFARRLGWFSPGGAAGIGAAFAMMWAYVTLVQLGRGRELPAAVLGALARVLPLIAVTVLVMRVLRL